MTPNNQSTLFNSLAKSVTSTILKLKINYSGLLIFAISVGINMSKLILLKFPIWSAQILFLLSNCKIKLMSVSLLMDSNNHIDRSYNNYSIKNIPLSLKI